MGWKMSENFEVSKETVNKINDETYILNKERMKMEDYKFMEGQDYKVWECKIVIAGDSNTPKGFDSVPKLAAEKAVEKAGFEVIANFSGWGGKLDENERSVVDRNWDAIIEENITDDRTEESETITIDMEDIMFIELAKMAHEKDIPFNEMVNIALEEMFEKPDIEEVIKALLKKEIEEKTDV
jgi:hypothetical protein